MTTTESVRLTPTVSSACTATLDPGLPIALEACVAAPLVRALRDGGDGRPTSVGDLRGRVRHRVRALRRVVLLALVALGAAAQDAAPPVDAELVDGVVALARKAAVFRPAHAAMLAEAFAASPRDAAARAVFTARVAELAAPAAAGDPDAMEIAALAQRCVADGASRAALRAGLAPLTARAAKAVSLPPCEAAAAICALADVGAALGDVAAVGAARAADAALRGARAKAPADDGGDAATSALLHAQLAVHATCGDVAALAWAVELQDRLDHGAWDEATARYAPDAPSACFDLERLARILDDDVLIARTRRAFAAGAPVAGGGEALVWHLAFSMEHVAPVLHLTLVGRPDEPATLALLASANQRVVPGFAITALDESDAARALRGRFATISIMPRVDGAPTAYLCTEATCEPPTTDPAALAAAIARHAPR